MQRHSTKLTRQIWLLSKQSLKRNGKKQRQSAILTDAKLFFRLNVISRFVMQMSAKQQPRLALML